MSLDIDRCTLKQHAADLDHKADAIAARSASESKDDSQT
jgi:hypothetical protein